MQFLDRRITNSRDPWDTSYVINFIEPLNNYVKDKNFLSRRQALKKGNKYIDEFYTKQLEIKNDLKEEQFIKKLN